MRVRLRLRRLRMRLCRRRPVRFARRRSRFDAGPQAGLHAYTRQTDAGRSRLHLRLESDGRALLLINADRAVHLNPTAARMAWLVLEGASLGEATDHLCHAYRVSAAQAKADFEAIRNQVDELARPDGACPVHDLNLEILAPFSQSQSAPYRMDLALTYRCNDHCAHCYNARPRDFPELPTTDWQRVIQQLWDVGVPHICFTGGEATLRDDLPDLVTCAEANGQITGLLSNGRRLSDRKYVDALARAGLDHVQITLESHAADIHDRMVAAPGAWRQTVQGIRNCLDAGLFVMTNTTLLTENSREISKTLDFTAELGVPTVGINALIYAGHGASVGTGLPEAELKPLLQTVRTKVEASGQRLIWYTPTQYCHFDPVQMQLGVKGCTAARYNMCVEPDGSVIPCQSYYEPLGNLLSDPWDSIWNHDLAVWLRERRYVPESCNGCEVLTECGGGCPLTLSHQSPLPASIRDAELVQSL